MHRTVLALVVAALTLVTAPLAAARPPSLGDFKLRPTNLNLQARVSALDKHLHKSGVQRLLAEANRGAHRDGGCRAKAFPQRFPPTGQWWCFDRADAGTGKRVEWIPQGVSTVADAQQDQLWGHRQAILVGWYDNAVAPEKGVRVTFLDPNTGKYRHVLLVYPYIRKRDKVPTYEIVGRPHGGIHAGGILWYGNYLYVADTKRGIRVFDMRDIFDLSKGAGDTKDKTHIGASRGRRLLPPPLPPLRHVVYRGFGYRYVMPQVGAWVNAAGPDNNDHHFHCAAKGAPGFSFISLDRSEVPDRLITGQYCNQQPRRLGANDVGRVARWPLDGNTGRLQPSADGMVHATEAYRLATDQIQGAVSFGGMWYLSRSRGASAPGQLVVARPDGAPTGTLRTLATRPAGIGPEDLSFWPARNQLWTVTEHAGKRMLYGVPR